MIQILRVTLLGDGERGLGQPRLQCQYRFRVGNCLRLGLAQERKYIAHVFHILLALLHALCVGPRIVIALRQPQATRAVEADHRC